MNRFKVAIFSIFVASIVVSLAGEALGFPPFLIKARKFGAKDCTFCHIDPDGGVPFNPRGKWLIMERDKRKADTVDVEWLVDYEAAKGEEKKEDKKEPATAQMNAVEKELMGLLEELVAAAKRRDTAVFTRVLADDFSEINADGLVFTKAQVLAAVPDLVIEAYDFDEVNTRVFGDAAIMTLHQKSKGSYKGVESSGEYRETLVWVRRNNRWQITAVHISRMGQGK